MNDTQSLSAQEKALCKSQAADLCYSATNFQIMEAMLLAKSIWTLMPLRFVSTFKVGERTWFTFTGPADALKLYRNIMITRFVLKSGYILASYSGKERWLQFATLGTGKKTSMLHKAITRWHEEEVKVDETKTDEAKKDGTVKGANDTIGNLVKNLLGS